MLVTKLYLGEILLFETKVHNDKTADHRGLQICQDSLVTYIRVHISNNQLPSMIRQGQQWLTCHFLRL
jgi:hypothetical protein